MNIFRIPSIIRRLDEIEQKLDDNCIEANRSWYQTIGDRYMCNNVTLYHKINNILDHLGLESYHQKEGLKIRKKTKKKK